MEKSPVIGDKAEEPGKIVVSIVVDKTGKVIKATAGARGSTINSSSLYRSAEEAAMNAKFDAPDDAPEEQRGTITFNFLLK
jgi:protein TonB